MFEINKLFSSYARITLLLSFNVVYPMQMKLTIFLILISSLIIGCIEKQPIQDSQKISDTYENIDYNINNKCSIQFWMSDQGSACNGYVKGINGKYVNWSGMISNIKDGVVYVQLSSNPSNQKKVSLNEVEKTTFRNLEIGQRIIFQGKINLNCINVNCFNEWIQQSKEIDLHDVRIQLE